MNLQYILDSNGQTKGVYIPIDEWIALIEKYKLIEKEGFKIPEWQIDIVQERIEKYKAPKETYLKWDDIEKDLNL
jgi:hypothetical protein